ncbi:phage head closure protein [Gracilibacillus marinus]|uniref:Phage head closure protein n=1 Tax=Gracilibacillus marinus TaxID=630535 RepID=A0ABV8VY95_9BACI
MRRDKVIYLIDKVFTTKNEYGDPIQTTSTPRKLFATKKSITRTEFYQANINNLKPELSFTVWSREYKGENYLKFNDVMYKIMRTYDPGDLEIELICTGLTNQG